MHACLKKVMTMFGNESPAHDVELGCPIGGCLGCRHLYVACAGRIDEDMPVA